MNISEVQLVFVLFNATVSLPIFCLNDLSIDVRGVLKSLPVVVLLSVAPFIFLIFAVYI